MNKQINIIANSVNNEIWRRFVKNGIMLDYCDLDGNVELPTKADTQIGNINAISWWTPIENGAFFSGLYLSGLCEGYEITKDLKLKKQARMIADGLLRLASVGETKGFIARGLADDGESFYHIGSDDQTAPWFYGLFCYISSPIPTKKEKDIIIDKMVEVANALKDLNWHIPCNQINDTRGDFIKGEFRAASRLLFICKLIHHLTGEQKWEEEYRYRMHQKPENCSLSRLELCRVGMQYDICADWEMSYHLWIFVGAQCSLLALISMENDKGIIDIYREGLSKNAMMCIPIATRYHQFDNESKLKFDVDWRKMENLYRPHSTPKDAVQIAISQMEHWEAELLPKRKEEILYMREPLAAMWILSLSPNDTMIKDSFNFILRCLTKYKYHKLYTSLFFMSECVCYNLLKKRGGLPNE